MSLDHLEGCRGTLAAYLSITDLQEDGHKFKQRICSSLQVMRKAGFFTLRVAFNLFFA